jgi:hypothetical protein
VVAHGKYGNSFVLKTIRMLPLENSLIDQACAALNGVERSLLVQEAVLAEAYRLGVRWSGEAPPPMTGSWPYLPDRGDEVTGERTSITISLALAEILARCAEHVGTSEPLFIIGSTLAYIGRLQALFRGTRADTPEDAEGIRAELQRIKLPPQYRHRADRRRG